MNNEPVAWTSQDVLDADHIIKAVVRRKQDEQHTIPLYTHPVSKAKDRFPNYESICLQCGTTIYKPAFKTLTDEEIQEISHDFGAIGWMGDTTYEFARAILKKASEK
jgi:hypothetical protein